MTRKQNKRPRYGEPSFHADQRLTGDRADDSTTAEAETFQAAIRLVPQGLRRPSPPAPSSRVSPRCCIRVARVCESVGSDREKCCRSDSHLHRSGNHVSRQLTRSAPEMVTRMPMALRCHRHQLPPGHVRTVQQTRILPALPVFAVRLTAKTISGQTMWRFEAPVLGFLSMSPPMSMEYELNGTPWTCRLTN